MKYRLCKGNYYLQDVMTSADYPENNFVYNMEYTANKNLAMVFYDTDSASCMSDIIYKEIGIKLLIDEYEGE